MRVHILGICGTFMAGIARLAIQAGHQVSGSDEGIYPPMSDQLEQLNIDLCQPYAAVNLPDDVDMVIVGNSIKRGNPEFEAVLNQGIHYISGPQWLYENVLKDRWVLAVAGTHGKTTTTSMLTWILKQAGLNPGYLIGGAVNGFEYSAELGEGDYFVIEADEYDSALFDKRSKFIHYHPRTLILNNLEFDHADIFDNLNDIKKQFHHLVRTLPNQGEIISNAQEKNLDDVLAMGCWSKVVAFNDLKAWHYRDMKADGSAFTVYFADDEMATVEWSMLGEHNVLNAVAAIAAAKHIGINAKTAAAALNNFPGIKRRLEKVTTVNGITIFDDFAHHPTAIALTLAAFRKHVGADANITCVLDFGSYTMRSDVHEFSRFEKALTPADQVYFYVKNLGEKTLAQLHQSHKECCFDDAENLIAVIKQHAKKDDYILLLSNTGFAGMRQALPEALN